jgi:EAL domain-containing protein (putative c-di-GMP-specific phosphodiesterase class I)
MLKSIIKMFKESGYKIICEGVETREMVDTLTEFGVDFLQGFYFSKPIPEDKFIQYVKDYNDL